MQVFLPYPSFEKSAQALDDLRLGAQAKEAVQLLCAMENMDCWVKDKEVKIGHTNHPVYLNYHSSSGKVFLIMYVMELCKEWYYRFGKQNQAFFTIEYFCSKYEEDLLDYSDLFQGDVLGTFQPKYIKGQKGKNQVITPENIYSKYQDLLFSKWNTDLIKPIWTNRNKPLFYDIAGDFSIGDVQVNHYRDGRISICCRNKSQITALPYVERSAINGVKNNV